MIRTYKRKPENTEKLNPRQKAIIKTIGNSPIMFAGINSILLQYSDCGNDEKLIIQLELIENIIRRHFNVIMVQCFCGNRNLILDCDIT